MKVKYHQSSPCNQPATMQIIMEEKVRLIMYATKSAVQTPPPFPCKSSACAHSALTDQPHPHICAECVLIIHQAPIKLALSVRRLVIYEWVPAHNTAEHALRPENHTAYTWAPRGAPAQLPGIMQVAWCPGMMPFAHANSNSNIQARAQQLAYGDSAAGTPTQ